MRKRIKQTLTVAAGTALVAAGCATATNTARLGRPATIACPAVYGHQGAQYERPPNTAASFACAAALGVGSEMDVQAEKGGWPVIMHNATIEWSTGATGYVAQLDWSYLSTLRATAQAPWNTSAWKDERVPSLDEALAAAGANGQPVLLDMHFLPTKEQFDHIWDCLAKHSLTGRVTILGNPKILGLVRMWYPVLATEIIEYPPAGYVRSAESAKAYGATYGLAGRYLSGPLVAYYHASGLKVATWTSDSPAEDNPTVWARLAAWGVDSITTGHPAELLAWEAKNCAR
jgi:glycerophosphoryl diester phosphodiesterase